MLTVLHSARSKLGKLDGATLRPMSVTPGARVGPYEVTALIGAGGMGQVFRARDRRLNRDVALNVLPREALTSEAHSSSTLSPSSDSGFDDGDHYFVRAVTFPVTDQQENVSNQEMRSEAW